MRTRRGKWNTPHSLIENHDADVPNHHAHHFVPDHVFAIFRHDLICASSVEGTLMDAHPVRRFSRVAQILDQGLRQERPFHLKPDKSAIDCCFSRCLVADSIFSLALAIAANALFMMGHP